MADLGNRTRNRCYPGLNSAVPAADTQSVVRWQSFERLLRLEAATDGVRSCPAATRPNLGHSEVPARIDLTPSDGRFGLFPGIAFVLLYTIVGIPLSRWADRSGRTSIVAALIGLWGLWRDHRYHHGDLRTALIDATEQLVLDQGS